jgi:CRP-like cAMP-binding protein
MGLRYRNGVFFIVEENNCPQYEKGMIFSVVDGSMKLPAAKPACLNLVREVMAIVAEGSTSTTIGVARKKSRFDCGGCNGMIRFEFKKEKEFQTSQMRLLAVLERKDKGDQIMRRASILRGLDVFKTLAEEDLLNLTELVEVREYSSGFPVVRQGEPAMHLYIVYTGQVEVLGDAGRAKAQLGPGGIFGETSILSGEPVANTVRTRESCQIVQLSYKNFRHIMPQFPVLQEFIYKLLVQRISQASPQRAEEVVSGLAGKVEEISPVELSQMINSNRKTGVLRIESAHGSKAALFFDDGELVHAEVGEITGQNAFYACLRIKDGIFKFTSGLAASRQGKERLGDFMALILEGMKQLDDEAGDDGNEED